VVVGHETAAVAESVAAYGLSKVYRLEHPLLKDFKPDAWVAALEWLCKQISPKVFLISHSSWAGKWPQAGLSAEHGTDHGLHRP